MLRHFRYQIPTASGLSSRCFIRSSSYNEKTLNFLHFYGLIYIAIAVVLLMLFIFLKAWKHLKFLDDYSMFDYGAFFYAPEPSEINPSELERSRLNSGSGKRFKY